MIGVAIAMCALVFALFAQMHIRAQAERRAKAWEEAAKNWKEASEKWETAAKLWRENFEKHYKP